MSCQLTGLDRANDQSANPQNDYTPIACAMVSTSGFLVHWHLQLTQTTPNLTHNSTTLTAENTKLKTHGGSVRIAPNSSPKCASATPAVIRVAAISFHGPTSQRLTSLSLLMAVCPSPGTLVRSRTTALPTKHRDTFVGNVVQPSSTSETKDTALQTWL